MKIWLKRAVEVLNQFWGYLPISMAGLAYLSVAALVVRFDALRNLDMVLVALALGVSVVCLGGILLVALRGLHLVIWLHYHNAACVAVAETGQDRVTEFYIPALAWVPFVNVTWKWVSPSATINPQYHKGRLKEACLFNARGRHQRLCREFLIEDLFGLAKVRFRRKCDAQIKVLPHYGKLLEPPLLIRLSSGDEISDPRGDAVGDRVDMRQYVRGDSPRTILWKVFARTRRLMVRVPERAMAARPRVCCYLVCAPGDEPAAALARVVLERNLLGQGWRFGCDGQGGYVTHTLPALERIAESGNQVEVSQDASQLSAYLQQAQQDGFAQCFLLLPPKLDKRAPLVAQVVAQSPLAVTVCLAVDGIDPPQTSSWRSWLFYGANVSRCTAQDLRNASQLWNHHHGEVMLVDREAGVLLGDLRHYQATRDRISPGGERASA